MKKHLTPEDFTACPVWKFDSDSEKYAEVRDIDDVPGDVADLRILADFTTPAGLRLNGAVVGVTDIYAIRLFAGDDSFGVNKHALGISRDEVATFLSQSGLAGQLSFETLFPLRFKTRWSEGGVFNDFEGVFEMPD
jgi:hypothetical protein